MTEFLVKRFVKNYDRVEEAQVRTAYGAMASMVGIGCNILLFLAKMAIGLLANSISVMADAFNNLSDAASSIVGFVGVKMAQKPADDDHPFGHGRIEYIAAFIVAFLVLQVGFSLFTGSVEKLFHPDDLTFKWVSVLVLGLSVGVKLWLSLFNRRLGKRINSKVMLATSADALGDAAATSAAIFSMLVYGIFGWNIDAVVGLAVSVVVMLAGINIARDTLAPLIGEAIDPELYEQITNFVEGFDGIVGTHDLIVHNYGPSKSMASIHAEVPNDCDLEETHEIIDRIEREAAKELGLFLVIHMDPVETKDENVLAVREDAVGFLKELDPACTLHDFRVVHGERQINLIFDMVVPIDYNDEKKEELKTQLAERLKKKDARYECVITVESDFVARVDEEMKQE